MTMEYQQLGHTDLEVSRVGYGCWAMGRHGWGHVDDADSIAAVRRGLDLGVNFFDTADVYGFGHSETVLAKALGGDLRRVHVATKGGVAWDDAGRTRRDISPDHLEAAIDASLKRMGLECLSLFQVHWPDGKTPIGAAMERLVRCQEAGKIRWIGCCNFNAVELAEALEVAKPASLQLPYNLIDRGVEDALLPYCREVKIPAVSYGSLAQGALSGKYDGNSSFAVGDVRARSPYFSREAQAANVVVVGRIREIAARLGKAPAQVAVRWVLDQPGIACALTGAKTADHIEENAGATGWTLTPDDRRTLEEASARARQEHSAASDPAVSGPG